MVKERQGLEIDPDSIPVDDPLAFQLLRGECFTYDLKSYSSSYPSVLDRSGIFLLEGMQYAPLLNRLPPMTIGHVTQIIALSRWPYLEAGVVDAFVDACHGARPPYLPDVRLNPILGDTYGFLAYSDQVVQLSELVGGFSPETEGDFFDALRWGGTCNVSVIFERRGCGEPRTTGSIPTLRTSSGPRSSFPAETPSERIWRRRARSGLCAAPG